ncbi:BTB/POZ and MATH domain-containing protein 2-like isoform X2 [Carex littledalei]|uniref:BTB/POZ and MATH domain-containing protein 2-like isoform X2 n=1 Tax=Carex littledalei TaxID=544730 RepID=A0A833RAV7_9POAL|nr:BTB/POZ and MATH domain-containing protein 2-like isoform X2 [Carex littledalei]
MASSFTTSVFQMKPTSGTHRVKIGTQHLNNTFFKPGSSIRCGTFTVGEYQWAILYYPYGHLSPVTTHISFMVELLSEAKDVMVILSFCFIDRNGIASDSHKESVVFKKGDTKGFSCSMGRDSLQSSDLFKDDSFTVECSIQILEPSVEVKNNIFISVPPSNMHQHLHHLLESGQGADISFNVKGETFLAHRNILASRSSVFQAELFGSMSESKARCIDIQDMEPQVFKTMLQFIYTDMLPPSGDDTDKGVDEDILAQHLTVAADRSCIVSQKLMYLQALWLVVHQFTRSF